MSGFRLFSFAGLLILASAAGAAAVPYAGPGSDGPGDPEKPVLHATRAASEVHIDGKLDEAAWAGVAAITEFTQIDPHEGAPASERTEARILFDDEALYVGVRLWDSESPTGRLGRRDMAIAGDSDWFGVMLDSDHDHRTAFGFDVNPAGVRRDLIKTVASDDLSWDAVWEVATTVDDEGWTAEYRIPFSQLRYRPDGDQTWGIQLERLTARTGEYAVSTFIPRDERAGVPGYGHLTGLENLRSGARLEVQPYAVTRAQKAALTDGADFGGNAGLDLQYRLTSEFTLNATLNPDFGQVELDPAVVNLSAFETFYDEKRPFFVEGSSVFDFGSDAIGPGSQGANLFYTRRIGRQPQLGAPGQASTPDASTILGAAKLTGRTAGGWSLGVVEATTQAEWVETAGEEGAAGDEMLAEPFTNYLATRASRQLEGGQTMIGGIFTAVNRKLATPAAADVLGSAAYTGGIDFRHEWSERTWNFSGFLSGSRVSGSPEAMARLQRSPTRNFQRPDADHVEFDPTAGSLGGYAAQLQVRKVGGRTWRGDVGLFATSPGYEVNDIGYQRRTDFRGVNTSITHLDRTPGKFVRSRSIFAQAVYAETFGGEHIDDILMTGGTWQFQNLWRANASARYYFPRVSDSSTRGGPLVARPGGSRVDVDLSSDPRSPLTGKAGLTYATDQAGGSTRAANVGLTFRPSPRLKLNIGPRVQRLRESAQYLTTVQDPSATATYGSRYVFAELDQTTVSLDTRVDVTFTPALTLELFAQPFLSSVDYGAPKELRTPGSDDFVAYGGEQALPNPDFNLRSLRGNAVLRWEWQPGSTLYLAWQQQREDFASGVGDFDFNRDRGALFRARPDNILMMKVSYWLNF